VTFEVLVEGMNPQNRDQVGALLEQGESAARESAVKQRGKERKRSGEVLGSGL
jgi:hypothetical protein